MNSDPGSDRWRLDLESHVLFAPELADGPEDGRYFWSTSFQHEVGHWVRWQSSSIGLLLSLLRRARTITACNSLNRLTDKGRAWIIDFVKARPLWSYAAGYEPNLVDPDFALSGQMWLDMLCLESLLLDSADGIVGTWPGDAAVGPALSDAWRAAESFPMMATHPGNSFADHFFSELPTEVALRTPDRRLTTRSIWESACSLDELSIHPHGQDADIPDHRWMLRAKLKSDRYGFAVRIAQELTGPVSAKLFGLVAWLATDPPLPFLHTQEPIRWSDFSPPYRFMRLYSALGANPVLRDPPSDHGVYEFADDLLRAAGLSRAQWPETPIRDEIWGIEKDRLVPTRDMRLDFHSHPKAGQRFVGSLNMLVKASLALRAVFAEMPSKYAYPHIDDIYMSNGDGQDLIYRANSVRSLLVPLAMDFKDGLHQGGMDPATLAPIISRQDVVDYIAGVYFRASLDSFIKGEDVRVSMLPRHFRGLTAEAPGIMERILRGNMDIYLDW